ncbi:pilus assembly protein HofM [Candidatus Williamhamiltonella defendens]|uniref:Pilus assembly protein HofM n=1 Tax=Candidatus Williamhamiltonella defendens TaxID=138072 RepID=A0A2D3TEP9_9ENTR|nr:pilus assembly protein PilM [Candidatus Hamiltonella defensa]ATW30516.1 pilus assembly protein HofM [Candidatus Hamiltonella defensa]ATW32527.1 pilus assembly protein HofM [Candidatus Hamiltonella defensa]ATW34277.1 pilus assembly protein HofM [Candidatus Hamiltonella defensa]AYB49760.1 pilus assembly protein HofM [Candidatus Hamiltonella defensa]
MFFSLWQVGLDIQMSGVRALAVLKRRYGWQVRYWWYHPLDKGVLQNGNLHKPEKLTEVFRLLAQLLPKNISLRINLPAQRILQKSIPKPDKRLREPACREFIQFNAKKQFSINDQTLSLDYRAPIKNSTSLLMTAAHQQEINAWQNCLENAGLKPNVIDISPCALRYMAAEAKLSQEHILLHQLENEWLWTSPLNTPFRYGLISGTQENIIEELRCVYSDGYRPMSQIYYTGLLEVAPPKNTIPWSPFLAFKQFQPPLPALPMSFALAGGLAVRPKDF